MDVFIDEVDFITDVLPYINNFKEFEANLKARFKRTRDSHLSVHIGSNLIRDSRIANIPSLATYIESSVETGKNTTPGYIVPEFEKITGVSDISYRFIVILRKDQEITELRIVPTYVKENLWNSILTNIKTLFQSN